MNSNYYTTRTSTFWHLSLLVTITIIAYFKIFNASFLSWDDGEYILHNNAIRGINTSNIKAWFSSYYLGNYHPLTLFSYSIDYLLGGMQPITYHLTSLLLHIGNACLLYLFIKRLQPHASLALMVALVFALHPSQTESVSWVAERKTLLSGTFMLLAMIQYVSYAKAPSWQKMVFVLLAVMGGLLSKGTVVALPLSLFAIDIWVGRPLHNRKVWIEKIPFLALSLIVGIVAFYAQERGMFLDVHTTYPFWQRCIFGGYAYVEYLVHFFVPVHLSAMYPHPKEIGIMHYLFSFLAVCIITLIYIAYRRNWRILSGGIVFYTAHIIFLLQLVPFGEALMADRYMYVACIGIIFPLVYYPFHSMAEKSKRIIFKVSAVILVVTMTAMTFVRNTAWQSDRDFFNALLDEYPNSAVSQYSVGAMYLKNGDYASAELHLQKAVRLEPQNYKAWYNLALLYLRQRNAMEAMEALDKSIAINSYYKALLSRAVLHHSMGNITNALADVDKVLEIQPSNALVWRIRGDCMEQQGNLAGAIECFTNAIHYNDAEPISFIRRGMVFSKNKQHQLAISDLNTAVALAPANGESLYYRAMVKQRAGMDPCADLRRAKQLGYAAAGEAVAKMCNGM